MIDLKHGDCFELLKEIPDNSVDLVIIDPPYQFTDGGGGGAFGSKKRNYHQEYTALYKETGSTADTEQIRIKANAQRIAENLRFISRGFDFSALDELCRVMKKINIYIWCSKAQLRKLFDYFDDKGCALDLICWHNTNPTPMCNNTYLSDTEYCVFAREKGVKIYGNYHTKKKFYVSPANTEDKKKYKHPTIKPLNIIETLIINSSQPGDVVLDCFMGSGTTGVAAKKLGRDFIGMEIEEEYFEIAKNRIDEISKWDDLD